MLYNGLNLPIPIIVVPINKTVSKELLALIHPVKASICLTVVLISVWQKDNIFYLTIPDTT
jgi:hypothetical protein